MRRKKFWIYQLYGLTTKKGYLAEDDQMNGKPVPGMYAEDVAKYYPVGAYNNEEGLVENWNERMIIPAMLKLLQNLYKRNILKRKNKNENQSRAERLLFLYLKLRRRNSRRKENTWKQSCHPVSALR